MNRFTNRVVLITGATGGLGSAIAQRFAEQGAKLALHYNSKKDVADALAQKLQAEYDCQCVTCGADIASDEAVNAMVTQVSATLGDIDVLVNNAGISENGMSWKLKTESWERVIATNLTGTFNCVRAVLPDMRKNRCGRIIGISSVVGIRGAVGTVAYSSTKAGLIGMTKTVAREVASSGITVNCVAPGYINAGMIRELPQAVIEESIIPAIPMQQLGETEDIANAVMFLASEEAKYITGAVIPVDGGFSM